MKSTTIAEERRKGKKGEKIQKQLPNKLKYKNNKYFSWISVVSIFSVSVSHRLPRLPRMTSNIELVSGPVIGAALTLIWSYSCMFLPLMSASASASAFYFAGHLIVLLHIP